MAHHKRHRIKWRRAGCQCRGKYDKNLGNVKPKLAERMREAARASWYWLGVLLVLLPVELYAQGAGTPPYRGVNNWPLVFGTDNTYDIGAAGTQRPRTGYFGTSIVTPTLTISGLAAARIPFSSSGGVLSSDAGLTYDGTTLEVADQFNASGPDADSNVEIGSKDGDANAGSTGMSVVIGNGATNTGNGQAAVIIGALASAVNGAQSAIAIGGLAQTQDHNSIAVGFNTQAGLQSIAIGHGASTSGFNSIALGHSATSVVSTFVAGSTGSPLLDVYFGSGKLSGTAAPYVLHGSGGFGTDNAGGALTIAGGVSTGSAAPGNIIFQTSTAAASGLTPQTLATRLTVAPTVVTSAVPVFVESGGVTLGPTVSTRAAIMNNTGFVTRADGVVGMSSSASDAGGGPDTAISRLSAGVMRAISVGPVTRHIMGGGAAIASAAALPVPTGNVFHVTGTTTVTSITSTNFGNGVVITLIFDGVLTVTDGSNLKLAGNFVTAADATLTLVYDGSNWYETSRSLN